MDPYRYKQNQNPDHVTEPLVPNQPAYQTQPYDQPPPPMPANPYNNPLRTSNAVTMAPPPSPDEPAEEYTPPMSGMNLPPPPPKKKKSGRPIFGPFLSTVALFLLAPVIALFIAAFVLQSYQVEGASMEKTLQNSDRLIVNKLSSSVARLTHHPYIPKRGDIIIFNQAGLPDTTFVQSKQLIKRVIGLPGERVLIANGKVTVYNSAHPEGFNPDTEDGYKIDQTFTSGSADVIVPDKQVFVLGDNRANSEDSRYFGPIQATSIVGKLSLRILPFDKARHF